MDEVTVCQREGEEQVRVRWPQNATGDPTLRWEVARGWRLGRLQSNRLSDRPDPFEKMDDQDVRRGKHVPRILVCLVLGFNPSSLRWLLSLNG